MLYLLPQHSDTQMGMYNQPRVRLLWLIFQRRNSKTKDNNHLKYFQSIYWILSCTLFSFEKTTLHSGPHSSYKSPWYMKATYSTVPWANYVNNGCWQLLWLIFHSGDLGAIAPHAGVHRADFHLMERTRGSRTQLQKFFSSATFLDFLLTQDIIIFYLTDSIQQENTAALR